MSGMKVGLYTLVGFGEGHERIGDEDLLRCQIIAEAGLDPHVMVYNREDGRTTTDDNVRALSQFQRLVNRTFVWRNPHREKPARIDFAAAWSNYHRKDVPNLPVSIAPQMDLDGATAGAVFGNTRRAKRRRCKM